MAKHHSAAGEIAAVGAVGLGAWFVWKNRGQIAATLSPPAAIATNSGSTTTPAGPSTALGIALSADPVSAITGLYRQYYGRAPDATGLAYWSKWVSDQVGAGVGYDVIGSTLEQQFATSTEEQQIIAAASNSAAAAASSSTTSTSSSSTDPTTGQVTYQTPYGPITTGNFKSTVNPQTGMETPTTPLLSPPPSVTAVSQDQQVINYLLTGSPLQAIQVLYAKWYNRAPDQAGATYWLQQIQARQSAGEAAAQIAGELQKAFAVSPEEMAMITGASSPATPTTPPLLSPPPVLVSPSPAPAPAPSPAPSPPLLSPPPAVTPPTTQPNGAPVIYQADLAQWDTSGFTGSAAPYAQSSAQLLANLYWSYLHRLPDVAGMNYWLNYAATAYKNGRTFSQVADDLNAAFSKPGLQGYVF